MAYKKPPRAKRPPTTVIAKRLTQFRGSRPTSPTTVFLLLFRRPTSLQNTVSINFCSDWSTWNHRHYKPTFDQTHGCRLQEFNFPLSTVEMLQESPEIPWHHGRLHHITFFVYLGPRLYGPVFQFKDISLIKIIEEVCPVVWQFPDGGRIADGNRRRMNGRRRFWLRRRRRREFINIYIYVNV